MKDRMLNRRAFTLIEILLVVVLLGILAAVVIPVYWDSQTSARIAQAETDISILNRQLALYNASDKKKRIKPRTSYRRAVRLLTRAGYLKTAVKAPEGLRYAFDGKTGKFSYYERGKKRRKRKL